MAFTQEELAHIAHLARLDLFAANTQAQIEENLNKIVAMVNQISNIPTENVLPMAHPFDEAKPFLRPDTVTETGEKRVVYAASARIGGDRFDESIVNYVRRNYGTLIGEATAERVKQEIGTAFPVNEVREIEVRGRNLAEGVPRSFTLNSNEILEALQEPLSGIVGAVRAALEQAPPELAADIAERGLVLTGGGALLRNLDRLLMEETGLPVIVADDPLTCVARGGGRALEMMDERGGDLLSTE